MLSQGRPSKSPGRLWTFTVQLSAKNQVWLLKGGEQHLKGLIDQGPGHHSLSTAMSLLVQPMPFAGPGRSDAGCSSVESWQGAKRERAVVSPEGEGEILPRARWGLSEIEKPVAHLMGPTSLSRVGSELAHTVPTSQPPRG